MLGYIYETTCLKTGKIYVGCKFGTPEHTKSYLGSGKILEQAVNKYGKENFAKRILDFADSKKQLMILEKFWIAKLDARNRKVGYNISEGGSWGDTISKNPNKEEICKKISKSKIGTKSPIKGKTYEEIYGEEKADEIKNIISKNHADVSGDSNPMFGKHHTEESIEKNRISNQKNIPWNLGIECDEETKKKIGEANKGNKVWLGKHHTEDTKKKLSEQRKGTIWVTNGKQNKQIKLEEFYIFEKQGFYKGRKIPLKEN